MHQIAEKFILIFFIKAVYKLWFEIPVVMKSFSICYKCIQCMHAWQFAISVCGREELHSGICVSDQKTKVMNKGGWLPKNDEKWTTSLIHMQVILMTVSEAKLCVSVQIPLPTTTQGLRCYIWIQKKHVWTETIHSCEERLQIYLFSFSQLVAKKTVLLLLRLQSETTHLQLF